MKYWTINKSLDRRIQLQKFDKESYAHLAKSALLTGILIGALITTFILPLFLFADTITYHPDKDKEIAFQESGGCVWDQCSSRLIDQMLEENNNLLPPTAYEEQSWEWLRSVCTYSPERCK